jgi:hypothetical protein
LKPSKSFFFYPTLEFIGLIVGMGDMAIIAEDRYDTELANTGDYGGDGSFLLFNTIFIMAHPVEN